MEWGLGLWTMSQKAAYFGQKRVNFCGKAPICGIFPIIVASATQRIC